MIPSLGEIFGFLFDIGVDILATTLDAVTGTITAQIGDVTKDRADSDAAELWYGAPGLVTRPAPPTQGKASCQGVFLKRGDHDIGIAYRDLRANEEFGNLAPGEGALYATVGRAKALVKADGSSRQYTTDDNTKTGNAVWAGVSSYYQGTDGQPHLGGEWRYYAPWGGGWHDPSGYHIRTHHGVKVDFGGLTLPAPVSATVATATIAADVISLRASAVKLGNGAAPQPFVLATQLQALMGSFAADLETFTVALTAFTIAVSAAPIVGAAAVPLGAASSALGNSTTALMATLAFATGAISASGS